MSSKPRKKGESEESWAAFVEILVWVCFAIAAGATLYFLMREPEDGPLMRLERALANARAVALAASLLGIGPGIWYIWRHGGAQALVAMAVLFNIILASFWLVRLGLGV